MNLEAEEARQLYYDISNVKIPKNVTVFLAVPFPYLASLSLLAKSQPRISIVAQNVSQHTSGAYTGEVSYPMLRSIGVNWCVIGHSERRSIFQESNEILKDKVNLGLKEGSNLVFCCGEPLSIRKKKTHKAYVENQLTASLWQLSASDFDKVVIAYEPIWAIGTGVTASAAEAQEMHQYIRLLISQKYNKKVADQVSILYGGSVKPANAKELFSQADVDGGLVGGASLKAASFSQIIKSFG